MYGSLRGRGLRCADPCVEEASYEWVVHATHLAFEELTPLHCPSVSLIHSFSCLPQPFVFLFWTFVVFSSLLTVVCHPSTFTTNEIHRLCRSVLPFPQPIPVVAVRSSTLDDFAQALRKNLTTNQTRLLSIYLGGSRRPNVVPVTDTT